MIRLPDDVHAHLKSLAAGRQTTMVDVIRSFIDEAIQRGELDSELPGFMIVCDRDSVTLESDPLNRFTTTVDFRVKPLEPQRVAVMHHSDVEVVATALEEAAMKGGKSAGLHLQSGAWLEVARQGKGVVIANRAAEKPFKRSLTVEEALSLAKSLRTAAAKIAWNN